MEEKNLQSMSADEKFLFMKQGFHQFLMTQYDILKPLLGVERSKEAISGFLEEQYEIFNPNGISGNNIIAELETFLQKLKTQLDNTEDYSEQEYYADLMDNVSRTILILNKTKL